MDLKKEKILCSKNLVLRDVDESDAEFILGLRTDPNKSRFLSATSASINDQINWLRSYKNKSDQAYFIIEDKKSTKLGCVRMYNPSSTSFAWGSWIIVDGAPSYVALESALVIYSYARRLGFTKAKIDVRKENASVWKFHEKVFGAILVDESATDRFYEICAEVIDQRLEKYSKFLTVQNE